MLSLIFTALVGSSAVMVVPTCANHEIRIFVENIETVAPSDLEFLFRDPVASAGCLLRQLRIVRAASLEPSDQEIRPEDLRVIWTLRALRFMTDGQEFFAPLTNDMARMLHSKRREFLTKRREGEVAFFSVWMSRDIIYIAPHEAQRTIISKWMYWYETQGKTYPYKRAASTDQWYF